MPKVRREAVNMVKRGHSMRQVAKYYGFNPSTISRWVKKAPSDGRCSIETKSSRPKSSPRAIDRKIVRKIIKQRRKNNRCSEVVHQELLNKGIVVSLSTVKRTLDREGLLKKRSPWKRRYISIKRPMVEKAGDLLQLDTIHVVPVYGEKFYIYTIIDVYSRWAYAMVSHRINTHQSLKFLKRAMKLASFKFTTIQSDNGQEFSSWFTEHSQKLGLVHRHSRVRTPNDNSYIERFNRTLKEEGLYNTPRYSNVYTKQIGSYLQYYNNERLHLGINLLTPLQVLPRS